MDGWKYVGEWRNGNANGQGTYTWVNGTKYVCEYSDDNRNGQGTFTYVDGNVREGIWKNGKFFKPWWKFW